MGRETDFPGSLNRNNFCIRLRWQIQTQETKFTLTKNKLLKKLINNMPQQEAHQIFIISLCIFVLRFLSHHCSCVLIWIRMGFPCGFRILDPDFTACCELFCILGRWDTDGCGGAGGGPYPRHQRIRGQAHLLWRQRRGRQATGTDIQNSSSTLAS